MLKRDSIVFESVRALAVISVAVCLIPAGAHFFELANKMSLSTADYMTTQKIYAGWSFFGVAMPPLTAAHPPEAPQPQRRRQAPHRCGAFLMFGILHFRAVKKSQ